MASGGVPSEYAGVAAAGAWPREAPLIGVSAKFRQILDIVDELASNDCLTLVEGESGTGKELIARRIHFRSNRSAKPFIPVNCAGISDSLFESQFYGHIKGAFTGATSDTLGIVRTAEGGTLLLDEIGDLPPNLQPKLLRLLQQRELTPVGASKPVSVNVRFLASTNRSLARAVEEGTFRGDLFHRLNVVRVHVPPLRERPEDISALLDHYNDFYAKQYNQAARGFPAELRKALLSYPWPGNVRELCAYLERLYATNTAPKPPGDNGWEDGYRPADPAAKASGKRACSLAEAEAQAICDALRCTGNNRSAAAKILNIHRSTLIRKIRELGLEDDED